MCAAHVGHHDLIVRDKQFFRFAPSQPRETFVDILPPLWTSVAPEPNSSAESLRQKHPSSLDLPTTDPHCYWGSVAKKEDGIQPFAAGIALIRHFLSSKLSHLSNDPLVQVIARSVGRDLSQNLCFAAKPGVTALPNALSDKEINYGESHSSSERERQSCPNRNPPSGGRAQIPRHV